MWCFCLQVNKIENLFIDFHVDVTNHMNISQAYNRFFDFRQEECGIGGCLMELFIQLAIIMIGE